MPLPATFSFDCFGMPFDVGIRRLREGGAELAVRGSLGTIPYSAESLPARDLLQSVVDAGRSLPMISVEVDRKQTIIVRSHMSFRAVPSPANVAAGVAAIAIAVKPLCDLVLKSRELKPV